MTKTDPNLIIIAPTHRKNVVFSNHDDAISDTISLSS